MRFLMVVKGDENHAPPPPALFDALNKLMKDAGDRLVSFGGLTPSADGARARLKRGKVTVADGPFTETKEVIGGFVIYELASLDEAKQWARQFLDIHIEHMPGWDCEVEIRQMMDDGPPPA